MLFFHVDMLFYSIYIESENVHVNEIEMNKKMNKC